jgi:VanZ family protein
VLRLVPPLAWTVLIWWLSGAQGSADRTRGLVHALLAWILPWAAPEQLEAAHWLVRKSAHVVEYAVLAELWRRALGGWMWPLGLSVLTAGLDEWHQAWSPTREGSAGDALLDSAAAGAVLLLQRRGPSGVLSQLTGALLWIGAVGGTVFLALHWLTGAPGRWLWWSAPSAWVALALWRRASRRDRRDVA